MERGEQLSALLDGELDELATARLLRALDQDDEGLAAWEEYGLIGEVLRDGTAPGFAGRAGAQRALASIALEAPPRRPRMAWLADWRQAAPWAVAASAAAAAFVLSGPALPPAVMAWVDFHGTPQETSEHVAGGDDPMARYIDYHRELAAPGFERTAFAVAASGSGQGR